MDALSVNLCSCCSSFPCFVVQVSLFVRRYQFFSSFFSAYKLAEVTEVMIVRRQHRLVGTGVTGVGECTDTLHHCLDIGVTLTPEDWRVWSVVQFLNSPSTQSGTGCSHCRAVEYQGKLFLQPRCAKPVTITCTTRGTK